MPKNAKRKTRETQRSTARQSSESPLLEELRRRLSEPAPWAHRFRRLAEAIAKADDTKFTIPERSHMDEQSGLSCEETEELLDLYLDDEMEGRDVQQLYPQIWRHLLTCDRCQQAHELLIDTLSRERAGSLLPVPHLRAPRLTFLQPHSPEIPWIVRLRSQIAGAPFGLVLSFNPSYLRTLLSPLAPLAVRAEAPILSPKTHLLLSDNIPVGEQSVAVQVTATQHPEKPDHLALQAIITGSASLPVNLWATLMWASHMRVMPVDVQGHVDFGEVSLDTLREALEAKEGRFEITFEVREPKPNAEAPGG